VWVPQVLLEKAQQTSGTCVDEAVRAGLRLVAASRTYARILRLRGKVRVTRTLTELNSDRRRPPSYAAESRRRAGGTIFRELDWSESGLRVLARCVLKCSSLQRSSFSNSCSEQTLAWDELP